MKNTLSMLAFAFLLTSLVACGGRREGRELGDAAAYARYATAELLYEKGDLDGARRALEEALATDEDDAYLAARLEEVLAEITASEKREEPLRPVGRERGAMSIEIRTGQAAASAKKRARALSASLNPSRAAEAMERALELDPGDEELRLDVIDLLLALGETDRAERHVLSLRAPDEDDRDGAVRYARLLARVGRPGEAKELLLLMLERFPNDSEILLALADVERCIVDPASERDAR